MPTYELHGRYGTREAAENEAFRLRLIGYSCRIKKVNPTQRTFGNYALYCTVNPTKKPYHKRKKTTHKSRSTRTSSIWDVRNWESI